MADSSYRGKSSLLFHLVLLLLFFASRTLSVSDPLPKSQSNSNPIGEETNPKQPGDSASLERHQAMLEKLEKLVINLNQVVARLESQQLRSISPLSQKQTEEAEPLGQSLSGNRGHGYGYDRGYGKQVEAAEAMGVTDGKLRGEGREARGRLVVSGTKYSPFWTERFYFVSAVKLDSDATCINVLPFRDSDGLNKYVAIGDERGRVYVILRNGDVASELQTLDSPVTAMVSYISVYKNESVLVTGHGNGVILMHRVWKPSNGDEWSSLLIENVGRFASLEIGEAGSQISILDMYLVGRARYIISTYGSGKIGVFRENGTVYGSVVPNRRPLAFMKQRLMFLTEVGAGSLDLRTMNIKESECEGLNYSIARNYVFDAAERSKAYGFTSNGDLIQVILMGDVMNIKCRVRSVRKLDMAEPLILHAIKGYLLLANHEKVSVYNISSQHYARAAAPRLLFTAGLDEIRSSFLNYQVMAEDLQRRRGMPLIASDWEKLVVFGLGDGYVGTYRSNLPLYKGESSTMQWTSPVLFFIIFLFGAWHFFTKKKESLASWGPDDPFSSSSGGNNAPQRSGSGNSSFSDSFREADFMDLRGGDLRGPSRRYVSPPRYPGGAANSFRLGSADHNTNPRHASADPNFRTASELKFRGPNIE